LWFSKFRFSLSFSCLSPERRKKGVTWLNECYAIFLTHISKMGSSDNILSFFTKRV
jgi:hypothetical protein